jgi:lysophospholipase L1-like esterase
MGPGRVTYFDDGTEIEGENGGTLSDYYELSAALAEELNVDYLDIYQDFPEGNVSLTDVLADGCHYNEYGRYLLGIKIINSLDALVK